MAPWLRGFRHQILRSAWLLVAACGSEPGDPAPVQGGTEWRDWQARADQAAREQQAREDAEAAELQQAVQAVESDPPDVLSEQQLYQELHYYCGVCHFPAPPTGGGEQAFWMFFDDLERMIQRSDVIPGDAEGSRIIEYIRQRPDHVPPGAGIPAISQIAIHLIADFIDQLPPEPDESARD